MDQHDVAVIGAGLAGLRAAGILARAGLDVVVLEASDAVGGRQRTDEVDGFRLDRGFQVLNPAYPALRRVADLAALRLASFPVGVRVRRDAGSVALSHPLRHPLGIPATLRSGLLGPAETTALARWAAPALLRSRSLATRPDRTLAAGWDRAGFDGPLRHEVLEPFLAGVLADDEGITSESFALLLLRTFARGAPGLPEDGIRALPAQLARRVEAEGAEIRTDRRVRRLRSRDGGIQLDVRGARAVRARAVVVAVDPAAVPGLVAIERPPTRGLQTWWFDTDTAPTASALLAVDGRRRGPIVNTAVISHTAPSYAPAGRHLIQATSLLPARSGAAAHSEVDVRRQLAEIWGADAASWRLLRRDDLPDALPAQNPPLQLTKSPRIGRGTYIAGDHRATASIQGALVSGEIAARALLADLRTGAGD